jgi:hypothetical protein
VANSIFNPLRGLSDLFVLPDPDHRPTFGGESRIGVAIARDIRDDLGTPPCGIIFGRCEVLRTTMPKASVDEDHHTLSWEYNVRSPATSFEDRPMDAESKAPTMQFRSE